MSYLDGTRLHFAGTFQAAVSTVNNDPAHYDNAQFDPSWWEVGNDGSWNPQGDGAWRLIGCAIKSAFVADRPASADDRIFACTIADSDRSAPAKLVDLDPDQQMVSTIFGLTVRIADAKTGETLVRGDFEPAPFTDIWQRCPSGAGGDMIAGAMYQSVLTNVRWEDTAGSPLLAALAASSPDTLSICFNVDGYGRNDLSPDFTLGRIVGTIGPHGPEEPRHLTLGRHFMATKSPGGFFAPAGKINFCTAVVDEAAGMIRLDLGNALPTTTTGGPAVDLGTLQLTCPAVGIPPIGEIDGYTAEGWYESTAGLVAFPASPATLAAIADQPLAIVSDQGASISEAADGVHVRADTFVFRLESGGAPAEVDVYGTRFGKPADGLPIDVRFARTPAEPQDGLTFDASTTTDGDGRAPLKLTPGSVGDVRAVDGQVYRVRPTPANAPAGAVINPSDVISVLVWSDWKPDHPVTWWGSLQPIFQQFSNLYPVMARFLDLSSYASVNENVLPLRLVFGLPVEDPNSMPVTRDLSPVKRAAILEWLGTDNPPTPLREGKPPAHPPAKPRTPVRALAAQVGGKPISSDSKLRFVEREEGQS